MVFEMAKKTTKTKTKKQEVKKEEIPEEKPSHIDEVYNTIMTGNLPNTPERVAMARALVVLRTIEMKRETAIEVPLNIAYKQCREAVFKAVLEAIVVNELRLIDAMIIMEMLYNESAIIPVWEYENLDESDLLIGGETFDLLTPNEQGGNSSMDFFKCLGGGEVKGGDADDEEG